MAFVFLDGVCVTLTSKLDSGSTNLTVSQSDISKLCEKLGDGNHSYLTMNTNQGSEILKITCNSSQIVLERGLSGSTALTGSVGRCLCFQVNKAVIDDYITSGLPEACEPTIVTDNEDVITITPPEEGSCEWVISLNEDFLDRLNDCCPEDDCNNCTISDGTYENATISVVNGKVCSVATGTNIVYTGGGCCGCNTKEVEDEV